MSGEVQVKQISDEQVQEATLQLDQAVALINSDKVPEAVVLLGKVVSTYVDKYGEVAPQCAPIYFRLGQALLFQAQDAAKNTVGFDVAEKQGLSLEDYDENEDSDLEGDSDSEEECDDEENNETGKEECGPSSSLQNDQMTSHQSTEEPNKQSNDGNNDQNAEKQSIEEQIDGAEQMQPNEPHQNTDIDGNKIIEGNNETNQTTVNRTEGAGTEAQQNDEDKGVKTGDQEEKNGDDGVEQEEEEQLTGWEADLQLAWQNLEVARCIYEKQSGEKNKSELAEIHLCLGDVSAEREDFEQATVDYKKCLEYFNSIGQVNEPTTDKSSLPATADANNQQPAPTDAPSDEAVPATNTTTNSTDINQFAPANNTDTTSHQQAEDQTVSANGKKTQTFQQSAGDIQSGATGDSNATDQVSLSKEMEKEEQIVRIDEASLRIIRRKAEAYFKLALVLQFSMRFSESEKNIEVALEILNNHLAACKQLVESSSEEELKDKDYIKKYLQDLPGTIEDLKNYQDELKSFRSAGSMLGLKAAIEKAQEVADREDNDGAEKPSSSKVEEPKVVQDLGVVGRSKKKLTPTPLAEQNQDVQNTSNYDNVGNNDLGKRTREDAEKQIDGAVEDQGVAVKKLKIDEKADTVVEGN